MSRQFKGTPGPWHMGAYGCNGCVSWFIGSNQERDGCNYVVNAPNNMTETDALLIAAAPELLEALQGIINNSDPFHSALEMHHNVDVEALYENAVKAINKALGEEWILMVEAVAI